MQLNLQLLRLTGEARFADQLERSAYNQLVSAQLSTGDQWCYYTPLEGKKPYGNKTNCCLSSGPRGIALIPTFAYATEAKGVVVNLFEPGKATLRLADGAEIGLEQKTSYPFSGESVVRIGLKEPKEFSVKLRSPAWAGGQMEATQRDGAGDSGRQIEQGYLVRTSLWKDGDEITVRFPMPIRIVEGDHTNQGKIALVRGPLLLAASDGVNPKMGGIQHVALPVGLEALGFQPVPMPASVVTDWENRRWQVSPCPSGAPAGLEVSRMTLLPLAQAGEDGSYFQVWFPKCDAGKAGN
jgi:DUF1680 family protein